MGTIKSFEELEIWQDARRLTKNMLPLLKILKINHECGLRDQLSRSSSSVMNNIAEGFSRGGNKEFAKYLWISRASASEVRSQLYQIINMQLWYEDALKMMNKEYSILVARITRLIQVLEKSDHRGWRYQFH